MKPSARAIQEDESAHIIRGLDHGQDSEVQKKKDKKRKKEKNQKNTTYILNKTK